MANQVGQRPKLFWFGLIVVVIACAGGLWFALTSSPRGLGLSGGADGTTWTIRQDVDKLTGNTSIYADEVVSAEDGGHFGVRADCGKSILTFTFDYHGRDGESEASSRLETNTDNNGTSVPLRMRIDDHEVKEVRSESKFANEAAIFFYDDRHTEAIFGLMGVLAMPAIRARGAGTIKDFVSAKSIGVELPLENGQKEVVIISPHEASIQPFFAACIKGGLFTLRSQQSSAEPKDTQPLPPCVYGTEMIAKENAVIINADGSTTPLDRSVQGAYFMPQPDQDNQNPDQCNVKSERDDKEYVIPRNLLKQPE